MGRRGWTNQCARKAIRPLIFQATLSVNRTQRTIFTPGLRAAVSLAHGDYQGVEFVKRGKRNSSGSWANAASTNRCTSAYFCFRGASP